MNITKIIKPQLFIFEIITKKISVPVTIFDMTKRIFIAILVILLLSGFDTIKYSHNSKSQENFLFVNFESLSFNQKGLDFFKGHSGQHYLMTIGLKNDSGKDIQALYYKFYILDLVEPHSDITVRYLCTI